MHKVEVNLDAAGTGSFFIAQNNEQIALMDVAVKGRELTVYHTEVSPDHEDQGLAKLLLTHMVEYAREEGLKVIPLCRFVLIQFKKNKEEYEDVWKHEEID